MDVNRIIEFLRATLQADTNQQAHQQLTEIEKIIGFSPLLLQVVMSEDLDKPVKQAGAIYLKNLIVKYWEEKTADKPTDPIPFFIHEQDKSTIRENIMEAIIHAAVPVRVQLAVSVNTIVKHDYPGRWPGIAEKAMMYLQSDQAETWLGACICVYQLVKHFEYKNNDERQPLNQAMVHLLPLVHQRGLQLVNDPSEGATLVQKQVLKIFHALIQYTLPLDLVTRPMFTQWMELMRLIIDRPVPESTYSVDEDDRPELPWWKVKKWCMHTLTRVFERYGSPGNVLKEYEEFAQWYLKSFSVGVLNVLLKILDQHRQKIYVSPRVLQQTLNYLVQGVSHSLTWKTMKPHILSILTDILFPLMCHTDEDEDLWESDPIEYIRMKYDVFEEFLSPVTAAQSLLYTAASKRKEMLQKSMGFVMQVLSANPLEPRQKAGALQMVGAVAEVLQKKKMYKSQIEVLLGNHVYPELKSEYGYLRARACWVIHQFGDIDFKDEKNLELSLKSTCHMMCTDKDLPVRVEAAIAMQTLLTSQDESALDILRPDIAKIVFELLNMIRETENEDLTNVIQKVVCLYSAEVMPMATQVCSHLAQTFAQLVTTETDGTDERAMAVMGILNTLETICTIMEDTPDILQNLEGIILDVVGLILQQKLVEYYEEMLALIYSLTCSKISQQMWTLFPTLYEFIQNDEENLDYFGDMMPTLHNYVTVDSSSFISNPKCIEMVYNMCKSVLNGDVGEDGECHATKLLEVLILQFKGQIDAAIPSFVELVLERLTRKVQTSELRTMCLQVVVAALYYNPSLLIELLTKMRLPDNSTTIIGSFLKQWLSDIDCFMGLHDRKLSILGLCTLMCYSERSPEIIGTASEILPSLILLFVGIKRAYAARANEDEDSSSEEEEEEYETEELNDEEDEIDESTNEYLERLEKSKNSEADDDDEYDSDDSDLAEETTLESYKTPLDADNCPVDEYIIFKETLTTIQSQDPVWYQSLTANLTQEQQKQLTEIFKLAEQRRAAAESKKIEESGGYSFNTTSVPTSFNFGSS